MSEKVVNAAVKSVLDELGSPGAKRAYDTDWNRFNEWLAGQRVDPLEVTPKIVKAHLLWMREERRLSRGTVRKALTVIREMYRALVADEVLEVNPAREVKAPKAYGSLKTPVLTDEQAHTLFDAQPSGTWKERRNLLVLKTLLGLGWRRAEVARMRGEDFDGKAVSAVVKGGKTISVAVPGWLHAELTEWRGDSSGPVFPRAPGGAREISGNIVYDIVDKARKRVGWSRGVVTPHAMRRTFITLSGQRGVSLKARQLSVGHSSSSTTERYDWARDARAVAVGDVLADIASDHE